MELNNKYIDTSRRSVGFTGYCGFEFTEISDDFCTVSCSLRPELLNPGGIAHGGLIAALTDVSASAMAIQIDRRAHPVVTQSCSIHYLRPAAGDRLAARSTVIRRGKRVCVVQSDCFLDNGVHVATAVYEIAYLENRQNAGSDQETGGTCQ